MISPFNGKIYNGNTAVSNHLRNLIPKLGKSREELELEFFLNNFPKKEKCDLCHGQVVFSGLVKGFVCKSPECIKKRFADGRILYKLGDIDFQQYVYENPTFYKENLKKINLVDPYYGKPIGKITLQRFLSDRLVMKDFSDVFWQELRTCGGCLSGYYYSRLLSSDKCSLCIFEEKSLPEKVLLDRYEGIYEQYREIFTGAYTDKELDDISLKIREEFTPIFIRSFLSKIKDCLWAENFKNLYFGSTISYSRLPGLVLVKRYKVKENYDSIIDHSKYSFTRNDLLVSLGELSACAMCGALHNSKKRFCGLDCYHKSLTNECRRMYHQNLHTEESRKKASDSMIARISSGEFTPCITNSWTHVRILARIDGKEKKFRSSWEAVFQLFNPSWEYERLRIKYFDTQKEKHRIYIVDFVDHKNKELIEVKPDNLQVSQNCLDKTDFAKKWCDENGYTFRYVGKQEFDSLFYRAGFCEKVEECDMTGGLVKILRKYNASVFS